jgi:hypothetical protein
MMMRDRIAALVHSRPFRAFVLEMPGGRRYRINRPDRLLLSPNGRTVVWDGDDAAVLLDVPLIQAIREHVHRRRRSA